MSEELRDTPILAAKGEKSFLTESFQAAFDWLETEAIKGQTRSRYKGLGEMNPEELWETTLNPDNRTMLRVQYTKGTKEKSKEDQKMIEVLMGDEVAPRKDFITNNALDVANLDI